MGLSFAISNNLRDCLPSASAANPIHQAGSKNEVPQDILVSEHRNETSINNGKKF
jgi:hypothetical protein